jgi:hypothetical protein
MKNLLFTVLVIWAVDISADVPRDQVKEVNHLLDFIRNSGCMMERNGTEHSPIEAIEHILDKYDYFKDDINSTEDFIRLSATKSTLSGEYYTVKCPGKEKLKTQDWLLIELHKHRSR